jgi:NTE family protein
VRQGSRELISVMTSVDLVHDVPDVDLFSDLSETERMALGARLAVSTVLRGDVLMRQGDTADALYVVVSGRFFVTLEGRRDPVSEIGPDEPVGEIAFLTGGRRIATVTAKRDSLVLALSRPQFTELVAAHPGIWSKLTATLARRLAATTTSAAGAGPPVRATGPRPRTICLVAAGASRLDRKFVSALARALERHGATVVLDAETARRTIGATATLETPDAIARLNALEAAHDHVLMVADDELSPWTERAIHNADLVLAVGAFEADPAPNDIERLAARFVAPDATRLVLLHGRRDRITGTRRWLEPRSVVMHHHVVRDSEPDIERLVRFIEGTAIGLVTCGGGALCAAHIGVFKALAEHGVTFDIMGGTSAGAALAAAFVLDTHPDDIDLALGVMFVANRALGRYTLPRYALLDHTVFDAQLKRMFGAFEIEDLWLPFFAVSTNLSRFSLTCHRTGPLWRAIRASASIPVLLPPVYTDDGDMLVDGCLLDNVPLKAMRELKDGPNVVVSFKVPELDRFEVDYEGLPSRAALLRLVLNPLRRERLPAAPGVISVLMRALMVNRRDFQRELDAGDVFLRPPIPANMGFLDWHRHSELARMAGGWTRAELARLAAAGCPAWLAAVLDPHRTGSSRRFPPS